MKQKISMRIGRDIILNAIGIALCIASVSIQAQPMSAGARQGLYLEQQRLNEWKAQQQQQADWQAQQRAQAQWQARENAIQTQIAKYRVTPYYGSIAIGTKNPIQGYWGGGGKISRDTAERSALQHCGSNNSCQILATFANGCIGASIPERATTADQWIIVIDKDPKIAVEKSYFACEAKYGEGACIYAKNSKNNEKTLQHLLLRI
ncbi:MAG: DUF4189 domain-containing protein [Pseudomonadota bacterium]|nr:DUF4189 domain-containing protein [Pseudomonadota bacterium]